MRGFQEHDTFLLKKKIATYVPEVDVRCMMLWERYSTIFEKQRLYYIPKMLSH